MSFDDRLKVYKRSAFVLFPHNSFSDVPEMFRTPEGACSWMSTRLSSSFTPVIELFSQIPAELVSDDLRQIALMKDVEFLNHIDPGDTEKYLDLYISAHRKGGDSIQPHSDYQTASTVERMMAYDTCFEVSFFKQSWIADVMTQKQCDVACERHIRIMVKLPMERVRHNALEKHLKRGNTGYICLRREGKLKLAGEYLKSGTWPSQDDQPEPKNLQEALEMAVSDSPGVCADVYMAWVLAQPIEQVIPLMTSPALIDLAFELYSESELRPFFNTNRHLKAAFLESALGL